MTRILVIDNYDSFVYTLAGYLTELGAQVTVVRNDDFTTDAAAATIAEYDGVLISPGPGTPAGAGVSVAVVHAAIAERKPLLGVCLGHQAIAEALGATVTHARELMHGKTSIITHDNSDTYLGVPQPFHATRYHSLAIVDGTVPDSLEVTARTDGGVIMGIRHRSAPLVGVQFHPESVLTEGGYQLLANWLHTTGLHTARDAAVGKSPLVTNPSTN